MAIIYTYGFDDNVQDGDAWVGTNSSNRKTKQFSALSVSNYMNRYGRVSIGGQMSYKLTSINPGAGEMQVIGGGDGTNFVDIEFLNISTSDLSGAQVTEFLDYLVSTGLLISHQNNPSTFGHYTVVAYTPTTDPSVYKLELGILGGNGRIFLDNYYDLSPLNLAGGTGSGVNTIDTSEGSFITLTPTTPTAGNVLITADLSATGTPDATTFLRGDNTWAAAGEVDGSGTTNYVSKWQDPTTLTDSVIYDNGTNIGIGTTSPSQKLDIAGDAVLSTGGAIYGDTTNPYIRLNNTGGAVLGYGTSQLINGGSLQFQSTSGVKFRVNSGGGGYIVGNFGFGTTSPASRLEVQGGTTLSAIGFSGPTIKIGDYTGIGSTRIFSEGTNIGYSTANGYHDFTNAGASQMRITNTGNVGVGTTSPSEKLEVAGNIQVNGSSDSADGLHLKDRTFVAFSDAGSVVSRFRSSSAGVFQFQDGSYNTNIALNNNGNSYFNGGNVGIGTTSPAVKFHVLGSGTGIPGRTFARFENTSVDSAVGAQFYNGNGNFAAFQYSGSGYITGEQFLVYTQEDKPISFVTKGKTFSGGSAPIIFSPGGYNNEKVRFAANGNVGIGTTSPTEKLDVSGNIHASGKILVDGGIESGASIKVSNDTTSANAGNVGSIRYRTDTNNSYAEMSMQTGASTYAWVVIQQNTW